MFNKAVTLLVLSLYSTSVFGNCSKPVTPLNKGEPAPCQGFLFSPEKEKEIRLINEDYKVLTEQAKLFATKAELQAQQLKYMEEAFQKETERAEIWKKTAVEATDKNTKLEQSRSQRDWLFLSGGILLTVVAGFAVGQAAK